MSYIESRWGGEAEYQSDKAAGIAGARNWTKYAHSVVDKAVSLILVPKLHTQLTIFFQAEEYWPKRLFQEASGAQSTGSAAPPVHTAPGGSDDEDDFDRMRRQQLAQAGGSDGWKKELRRYLDEPIRSDITKYMDTVEWWGVSTRHTDELFVEFANSFV